MPDTPDPRQQVLDAQGHILVLGGPGSGKSTLALRKAVRRIEDGLRSGQVVLFLSFSRAAVARLVEASKAEVPAEKSGQLVIHTFHSFFWEVLRSHAYLLGAPKWLQILLPHDERALSGGVKEGSAEWDDWLMERERMFHEEGKLVFDLFAPKAAELFTRSSLIREGVASRFPLIIVDEAQDTGPDAWRCIELLAPHTQVLCLADLEQQIFDYLPGVGPERILHIEEALKPLRIDLGSDNNRSPGTEIVAFGNDVLTGGSRGSSYKGVSARIYDPKSWDPSKVIRMSLGQILKTIEADTGERPQNLAILAPSGSGVARISAALSAGDKPIPHKVLFDDAGVLLASRLAAFLLEPKHTAAHNTDVALSLELLAKVRRANGTKTALADAAKYLHWAAQARAGKMPKTKVVAAMEQLVASVREIELTGDPRKDWLLIKKALRASTEPSIVEIATHLDYLVAFNRGKRIAAGLSTMWSDLGAYVKAREALDMALAEDQIMGGMEDLSGIHVMTIHKSKAKQFDGVIILREGRRGSDGWESSFVWRGDLPPYKRSRKILRVAITRARKHVMLLDPAYPVCPILSAYKL